MVGLAGFAALVDDLDLCAFEIDGEGIAVPIPKILWALQGHCFRFQTTESITVITANRGFLCGTE